MEEQKQYKIAVMPAADRDIDTIADYLNTISEQTALKHLDKLEREINSLRQMPFRCPLARNEEYAKKGYRYLIINNYLVFFTVSGETVQIRRIIDGRSNYYG